MSRGNSKFVVVIDDSPLTLVANGFNNEFDNGISNSNKKQNVSFKNSNIVNIVSHIDKEKYYIESTDDGKKLYHFTFDKAKTDNKLFSSEQFKKSVKEFDRLCSERFYCINLYDWELRARLFSIKMTGILENKYEIVIIDPPVEMIERLLKDNISIGADAMYSIDSANNYSSVRMCGFRLYQILSNGEQCKIGHCGHIHENIQ